MTSRAFGHPGIEPRWTSSAKEGVGTAANPASRVWFTVSHGIVNEVYYPRIDQANTRDLGLIVTDGSPEFFSEEKRDADTRVRAVEEGVPAFELVNACRQGRYRITKTVLTDPERDVLLQEVRLDPLQESLGDLRLYALLAPHIGNRGAGNHGWCGDYKGWPMLFAERNGVALSLAALPFPRARSCGYAGRSDGWQDLRAHGRMTWQFDEAPDGNVALTAELDLEAGEGRVVLALGFGRNAEEAGLRARSSLRGDFAEQRQRFVGEWRELQERCPAPAGRGSEEQLHRTSVVVLRTHEAKRFPGGMIASLSVPWGASKGDDDLGGYHLVWPRDLVECASGLLAAGDPESARRTLRYLDATQEEDGHWQQNMWLDGRSYWGAVQMDEVALPVLLADLLRREDELDDLDPWQMVRRAACFLVRNGPVTQQDRWEEDGGYSPFTLAVEIAALLAAADFAEAAGEEGTAGFLRDTADAWNDSVERWTWVTGTDLAREQGVDGYYVRISPPAAADAASPRGGFVPIKNRPLAESEAPAENVVSPDALALVRFGLRSADDPRMASTVQVIDALLRSETATGPVWHRYNGDGYGEHDDGSPFDGTGVGRGWPLLAGERGHYELARGRTDEARQLLEVMERQASAGGLLPEQVWDGDDLRERELRSGYPSGSAMPLAWAHSEYLKLARSLVEGRIFDQPSQPRRRYVEGSSPSRFASWRFNQKCRSIPPGKALRLEVLAPATVRWSADGWATFRDLQTRDTGLGVWIADLEVADAPPGTVVRFTFRWAETGGWEGRDFEVSVAPR